MPQFVLPEQFLRLANSLPVIDARSPGEYTLGHIEGAYNIPLFDNEERAIIGTLYVKSGKETAVKQGMEMVGKKFGKLMTEVEKSVPGKEMLLHCWRGGMRSESLAWFFEKLGYKVTLLEGGYKAYRHHIRMQFSKCMKVLLVGGMTGSGKTELLASLLTMGQQTIDLEALANHKGSSFGHLGQSEQPTTEQFENNLFAQWDRLDSSIPLWLEHESNRIGKVFLPDTFHIAMQNGILLKIVLPLSLRIHRLVKEYSGFDKTLLEASFVNIRMDMGTLQCKQALEALGRNDFETVASVALTYYDRTYAHSLVKRPVRKSVEISLDNPDMESNARLLLEYVKNNKLYYE